METLSDYTKHNVGNSLVTEYLVPDINQVTDIPKKNIKGTKSDHNYELVSSYDSNGEYTYHLLCDKYSLEELRPQFENVVQHSDPAWREWKFKDMEDMLDQALKSGDPYYDLSLELWDDGEDTAFNSQGHYEPFKDYYIYGGSSIEDLKPKRGRLMGLTRGFQYYFKAINLEELEKICIKDTEDSF